MSELLVDLLLSENKALRDEIVRLKARLYDIEHHESVSAYSCIDWNKFLNDSIIDDKAEGAIDDV